MAAKKQLTPEQVKAAKQKKIAIVGAVLLVAVLAFEIPKVMKMMSAKPPIVHATAPTPTGATPAAAAPATDGAAAPATSAPVSAGVDSIVVKADLSPSPLEGQLPAFTATFTSKDPFRQQVAASNPAAASTAEPGPKKPAASIVPGDSGAAAPSTAGPSAAQPPASTAPPVSAVISVNGVDSTVGVAMDFPTDAPLFTVSP